MNKVVHKKAPVAKGEQNVAALTDTNIVVSSNAKYKGMDKGKGNMDDPNQHTPIEKQRGKSGTRNSSGSIAHSIRSVTSVCKENSITSPMANLGGGLGNAGGDSDDNNPQTLKT